jgi:hypothetical protein
MLQRWRPLAPGCLGQEFPDTQGTHPNCQRGLLVYYVLSRTNEPAYPKVRAAMLSF